MCTIIRLSIQITNLHNGYSTCFIWGKEAVIPATHWLGAWRSAPLKPRVIVWMVLSLENDGKGWNLSQVVSFSTSWRREKVEMYRKDLHGFARFTRKMSSFSSSWIFLHSKAFLEIWQAKFDTAIVHLTCPFDFLKWIVFQLFFLKPQGCSVDGHPYPDQRKAKSSYRATLGHVTHRFTAAGCCVSSPFSTRNTLPETNS